jgi:multidrug efflux system outer membrane protein
MRRTQLAAFTLTLALTGCTVGPKYTRPNVPAPPAFRGADNTDVTSDPKTSIGDQQWSAIFHEPELQDLIRTALQNNYDLRIAAEHILEQQQQVRITRSQQFPQVNAVLSGAGSNISSGATTVIFTPPLEFGLSASWTPDFWGLYRKQTEVQRDQLLAQQWAQRAVRVTLVQQVATTYFQLRALDAQLVVSKNALKARR